jgi:hypothetical protein
MPGTGGRSGSTLISVIRHLLLEAATALTG